MNQDWLVLMLVAVRIGCVFILFPVTSYRTVPNLIKIWLSLVTAYIIFGGMPLIVQSEQLALNFRYVLALGSEASIGLLIGFAVLLVFAGFRMAGQMVDLKMGLATAGLFDPQYGSNTTIISQFYHLLAIMVYLALNGHHFLFMALTESFRMIPPGTSAWNSDLVIGMFTFFVRIWALSFQIATPVIATVLIADFSLGLIAKTVPQIQVFLLGMPIKVFLGLLVVYVTLPYLALLMEEAFNGIPSLLILVMESLS
jgi:flagellar biosynthesis protein FliR